MVRFSNAAPQRLIYLGGTLSLRRSHCSVTHQQLIANYALEAFLEPGEVGAPPVERAGEFVQKSLRSDQSVQDTVAQGVDFRFEGEQMVGSALVFEDVVIHMAFLAVDSSHID